ncbi:hypothetical protein BH10PLA1_BH10PLA1_20440 [soil metagenome]
MLKLLLCLISSAVIAAAMLQLREQKREISYQISKFHTQIESRQAKLWSQQLQIAVYTAPNAISKTVGNQGGKFGPPKPLPAERGNWMGATESTDHAE